MRSWFCRACDARGSVRDQGARSARLGPNADARHYLPDNRPVMGGFASGAAAVKARARAVCNEREFDEGLILEVTPMSAYGRFQV